MKPASCSFGRRAADRQLAGRRHGDRPLAGIALAVGLAAAAPLAIAVVAPAPAQAAEPQAIGNFDNWQAVTFDESGKTGCYITSKPTKEEGKYSARGRVYVLVTHRPSDKTFDVVSFVAGYAYLENSAVSVTIDQTDFTLFTNQDTAWAPSADDDRKLVDAMKKGNRMVVKGKSARGTPTTDTYSLNGFSKAYQAIGEACPR